MFITKKLFSVSHFWSVWFVLTVMVTVTDTAVHNRENLNTSLARRRAAMPAPEADCVTLEDEIGSKGDHTTLTGSTTMCSFSQCVSDSLNIPLNAGAHSHI